MKQTYNPYQSLHFKALYGRTHEVPKEKLASVFYCGKEIYTGTWAFCQQYINNHKWLEESKYYKIRSK